MPIITKALREPHFNPEKLGSLPTYLLNLFGKPTKNKKKSAKPAIASGIYHRADIVEEKICDDVIKYMGPSLEKHKGCAIIDVNPGACIFSSKLHDFLKPKRHLLMEPEEKYVEPFIKPLLDTPGSTYRHTNLVGAHSNQYWENYDVIHKDPELFLDRPRLADDDPRMRQLDPSVLVIGNLVRKNGKANGAFVEMAPLIIHHMVTAALTNDLFHRQGLVRMLWWLPEYYKDQVIPLSVHGKKSINSLVSLATDCSEVVGVNPLPDLHDYFFAGQMRRRPAYYDRLTTAMVAERMEENGSVVPPGGEIQVPAPAVEYFDGDVPHKSPLEIKHKTAEELRAAITVVRGRVQGVSGLRGSHGKAGTYHVGDKKSRYAITNYLGTLAFPQSVSLSDAVRERQDVSALRTPIFVDIALRIRNLEANYKNLEDQDPESDVLREIKADIIALDEEYCVFLDVYSVKMSDVIEGMVADQLAFYCEAATSQWDRRPREPLKAKNSDFFPPKPLALLDFIPLNRDIRSDLMEPNKSAAICHQLVKHFNQAKNKSVTKALDGWAVNAAQDLIPQVPAMTDVRRGGRLHIHRAPCRIMTPEMIEGLVKAVQEWPFRPEMWSFMDDFGNAEAEEGQTEASELDDADEIEEPV